MLKEELNGVSNTRLEDFQWGYLKALVDEQRSVVYSITQNNFCSNYFYVLIICGKCEVPRFVAHKFLFYLQKNHKKPWRLS
jgi:hypothetical protein